MLFGAEKTSRKGIMKMIGRTTPIAQETPSLLGKRREKNKGRLQWKNRAVYTRRFLCNYPLATFPPKFHDKLPARKIF